MLRRHVKTWMFCHRIENRTSGIPKAFILKIELINTRNAPQILKIQKEKNQFSLQEWLIELL